MSEKMHNKCSYIGRRWFYRAQKTLHKRNINKYTMPYRPGELTFYQEMKLSDGCVQIFGYEAKTHVQRYFVLKCEFLCEKECPVILHPAVSGHPINDPFAFVRHHLLLRYYPHSLLIKFVLQNRLSRVLPLSLYVSHKTFNIIFSFAGGRSCWCW